MRPSFEKPPQPIHLNTEGEETAITISGTDFIYHTDRGNITFELSEPLRRLSKFLIMRANEPFLATHLKDHGIETEEMPVSDQFDELYESFSHYGIRKHFIKVGKGSATWYGFIPDSLDPNAFIESGLQKVKVYETNPKRVPKRQQAFLALRDVNEGNTHSHISRKQAYGAAATLVLFGGIATYVLHSHRHKAD